jgi:hypothetical protein
MDSWGYGILENDAAQSVLDLWKSEIADGKQDVLEKWNSAEAIIAFFEEHLFFHKIGPSDWFSNQQTLALAYLLHLNGFSSVPFFSKVIEIICNAEIEESLSEWHHPGKRKVVLEGFLNELGLKRRELTPKEKRYGVLPAESKAQLLKMIEGWLDDEDRMEAESPPIMRTFSRVLKCRAGYEYDNRYTNLVQQRMMLLALYTGWSLDMPRDQIIAMVKKAREQPIF